MENLARKYLAWYQDQDKLTRAFFCILWDIPSNLYRIATSASKSSIIGVVLAVLLMIFGGWVLMVIDILSIALKGKVYWLEDFGIDETKGVYNEDNDNDESNVNPNGGIDGTVE